MQHVCQLAIARGHVKYLEPEILCLIIGLTDNLFIYFCLQHDVSQWNTHLEDTVYTGIRQFIKL